MAGECCLLSVHRLEQDWEVQGPPAGSPLQPGQLCQRSERRLLPMMLSKSF